MFYRPFAVFGRIALVVLFTFPALIGSANAASTIAGTVYDKQRNPLSNLDIELLNDFYQTRDRAKTDGSGRYHFTGLPDGRYTVRVHAFRYDLQDQEIPVEIVTQNIRGGEGTGYFQQDFYLVPRKGGLVETELSVLFAQDVPEPAQKAYESADREFGAKRSAEGIKALNQALTVFPKYYLALHRMGKELFALKRYEEAVPILIRAAEINPKSGTTFYYLGYSLHKIGADYDKAAFTSLNNAVVLAPSSVQVLFALGVVERSLGKYSDAEKHLVQAKKLSKTPIPEIHKELAQLYADSLKKYREAADELESYLKASKIEGADAAGTKKVIANLRDKAAKQQEH